MRLRSLMSMSLIAGSLIFYSCGDTKKEKEEMVSEENHEMHDMSGDSHSEAAMEQSIAQFNDEAVNQAYVNYLAVKDAFVKTDAKAAAAAAKDLQASLKESKPEIAAIAGNIATSEDVNVQRELFSELTAAMGPILKDAITSGKIYKQFCPMAFEGKGDYWYSNSSEIRNPYYGDMMLKCGRVEETLEN